MSTATAVKERPILFSGEMVKAILAGTKTQTRRVVKPQPFLDDDGLWKVRQGSSSFVGGLREHVKTGERVPYTLAETITTFCKSYGNPGDRLWVRETWANAYEYEKGTISVLPCSSYKTREACRRVLYRATDKVPSNAGLTWKPSIHMKRADSRLLLEITDVRVQRLQDISEEDAKTEGCCTRTYRDGRGVESAKFDYQNLWNKINGPGSWDANPWVWSISFKRIELN